MVEERQPPGVSFELLRSFLDSFADLQRLREMKDCPATLKVDREGQ